MDLVAPTTSMHNTAIGPPPPPPTLVDQSSGPGGLLTPNDALSLLDLAQLRPGSPKEEELRQTIRESLSNLSAPFCRICRGNGDRMPLIECPCKCKGSMGYVHEICLQKWHVVRKAKVCEICHMRYEFPDAVPDPDFKTCVSTFFRSDCCGRLTKCLVNFIALSGLTYINSRQIQDLIEVSKDLPASPMLVVYLMFTGVSNFTYFEWSLHSISKVATVLDRWWQRTSRFSPGEFDDLLADNENSDDDTHWTFISDR